MISPVSVKKLPKAEAERIALEIIKRVGLSDKVDVYPSRLLGRAAAARGDRKGPCHAAQDHAV
jgi:polar amino acid transport system ATP-binding protein